MIPDLSTFERIHELWRQAKDSAIREFYLDLILGITPAPGPPPLLDVCRRFARDVNQAARPESLPALDDIARNPRLVEAVEVYIDCAWIARCAITAGNDPAQVKLDQLCNVVSDALGGDGGGSTAPTIDSLRSWVEAAHKGGQGRQKLPPDLSPVLPALVEEVFSKLGASKSNGLALRSPPFLRDLTMMILEDGTTSLPRQPVTRFVAFAVARGRDNESQARSIDVKSSQPSGAIYYLAFELIENGQGRTYIAPEQAFVQLREDFREGLLHTAPQAVLNSLSVSPKVDLRISLLQNPPGATMPRGQLLFDPSLEGTSATGAAALGLAHAWRGTYPDSDLIVLADAEECGALKAVGHLEAKVSAVLENDRFSTIVAANAKAKGEIDEILAKFGKLGKKRASVVVVKLPTTA